MPVARGEGPVGLIVCPSRELARQTYDIIVEYSAALREGERAHECLMRESVSGLACVRLGGTESSKCLCLPRWYQRSHSLTLSPVLPYPARPLPHTGGRRLPRAALPAGHWRCGHEAAGRRHPQHRHPHGRCHARSPQRHAHVSAGGGSGDGCRRSRRMLAITLPVDIDLLAACPPNLTASVPRPAPPRPALCFAVLCCAVLCCAASGA